jgi:hypothetical protein
MRSAIKQNIGVTPDRMEFTAVFPLARRRISSVRGDPCSCCHPAHILRTSPAGAHAEADNFELDSVDSAIQSQKASQ